MTETNHAEENAASWANTMTNMVEALNLDWERLEELRDQEGLDEDEAAELAELEAIAGEFEDHDDVEAQIQEAPLEIAVRSDWTAPGEELTPSEFCILLSTGGPALRIIGELDDGQPTASPRLQHQDWGTPWIDYHGASSANLLEFCTQFYFGE